MIKGKNQHVMPNREGWCVVDELHQSVVKHFKTKEEALAYAHRFAEQCESDVLLHTTFCKPEHVSSVTLPQREFLPGTGHTTPPQPARSSASESEHNFDPFLGYDDYHL